MTKNSIDDKRKNYKLKTRKLKYNKIFLLSDVHFGVRINSLEWLDNHLSFFYNFYIPYLKKNYKEGDILFFLGDWFDNKETIDIKVMDESIKLMATLSSILPIHLMTGNHDIYKKIDTDVNSLSTFKYIPNVYIYEEPIIVTNGSSKILIMPWVGNSEEEENLVNDNKIDYVFAHTTINGFNYDNGRKIEKTGSKLSNLKSVKKLFSGHIHKRQEDRNAIYIGSPYHTKRSDIGNQKAVYLFDPKEDSYNIEYNNYSPVYQRVQLSKILDLSLYDTINILNNNYTDILVTDDLIQSFNLTRFISLLSECSYKVIEVHSATGKIEIDVGNLSSEEEIVDILTLLEKSIKELSIDSKTLDILLSKNKEYYINGFKEDNVTL